MTEFSLAFPRAHDIDRPPAVFRQRPEDFFVEEELGFALSGAGEHLWVLVEKTGLNTVDVLKRLAQVSGVRDKDIGYAGLKDRQAVTRQWFSLKTDAELPLDSFTDDSLRLLEQVRNTRKLRRGTHRGNRFRITLRGLADAGELSETFAAIVTCKGVPNYFGLQRFGHGGNNLNNAVAMFTGARARSTRFQRGMYLSAARAYLFNQVLAERVQAGSWDQFCPGDVMALAGSSSVFRTDGEDPALAARLERLDIHPTGPLWGAGEPTSSESVQQLEAAIAGKYQVLAAGLAQAGLKQERRALRLVPGNLSITPAGDGELVVEFSLPRGAFATSVIREMVDAATL